VVCDTDSEILLNSGLTEIYLRFAIAILILLTRSRYELRPPQVWSDGAQRARATTCAPNLRAVCPEGE
jgi:hypothetical protein